MCATMVIGLFLGVCCPLIIASCREINLLPIEWRTEDYEGSVGNALSSYREWCWISLPNTKMGIFSVNSGRLPPGVTLTRNGQLLGTPINVGTYNVSFKYQVSGFKTSKSNPITFQINSRNVTTPTVAWTGDLTFRRNENIIQSNGKEIFTRTDPIDGTWAIREGFSLPAGLSLDTSTGKIYGIPTTVGDTEISYEYIVDGYNKDISPIYFIRVESLHTLVFNGRSAEHGSTNNLSVEILSEDPANFTFSSFTKYLWMNNYTSQSNYITPSGTINNGEWTPTKLYLKNNTITDYFMTSSVDSYMDTRSDSWYSSDVTLVDTIS